MAACAVLAFGCAALAGLDEDFVVGSPGASGSPTGSSTTTTGAGGTGLAGGGGTTASGGAGGSGASGSWYDSAWAYRKEISVDSTQVAGDLSDFPLLVRLTSDADLAAHAQSGDELVFTAADGTTRLAHEIERFEAGGHVDAWVRVPLLSSTEPTQLFLYYGNPGAPNQQDAPGVWGGSFVGVWHLQQPSGTRYDSTSHQNHVVEQSGPIATVPAPVSGGATADFESSYNQHLTVHDGLQDGLDVPGALTLTAWLQAESQPGGWRNYLSKWAGGGDESNPGNSYYLAEYTYGTGHLVKFAMADGVQGLTTVMGTTTLSLGVWYHVAAVYDGAQMRIYVNGVAEGAAAARAAGARDSTTPFDIGGKSSNPAFNHDGPLDEVRVANVARSETWIATAYRNQSDPEAFLSVGAEQLP